MRFRPPRCRRCRRHSSVAWSSPPSRAGRSGCARGRPGYRPGRAHDGDRHVAGRPFECAFRNCAPPGGTRVVSPTLDRSLVAFAAIVAGFPPTGCSRESSTDPDRTIFGTTLRLPRSSCSRRTGEVVTSKAEDYRRRARACLLMAGTIADDETRAALVEMAQVWTRLADEQEAAVRPSVVAQSSPVMQQQQQIQSKKTEK